MAGDRATSRWRNAPTLRLIAISLAMLALGPALAQADVADTIVLPTSSLTLADEATAVALLRTWSPKVTPL